MIATAATGSVGARIAPSVKPSAQPKPGTTSFIATATAAAVAATRPIARTPIRRACEPQVARRGREAGAVDERREEDEEREVGVERDAGQAGHEPDERAADDEHDRRRDADPPGDAREHGDGPEQADEDLRGAHVLLGVPRTRLER